MRASALLLLLAVTAAACGANAVGDPTEGTTAIPTPGLPISYTGPDGVTSEITDASRIITLSGDFTEIVYELGLGDNIVAVDLTSLYPPDFVNTKPKIGVEFEVLAEPILAQEPTVVIGDEDAVPQSSIDQVRAAGIPVVIFPSLIGPEAPAEKIRLTARVLGIDEAGDELASKVQGEIEEALALLEGVESRPVVAFMYIASDIAMFMFGENSLGSGILDAVGAESAGRMAGMEGTAPFTPEALAAAAPEYIITGDRNFEAYGGLEGILSMPGVAATPAGRNESILVYDDLLLLGYTPRFGQLLKELILALHPELGFDN
jgi:iron complex transport system substrate-binding protein